MVYLVSRQGVIFPCSGFCVSTMKVGDACSTGRVACKRSEVSLVALTKEDNGAYMDKGKTANRSIQALSVARLLAIVLSKSMRHQA